VLTFEWIVQFHALEFVSIDDHVNGFSRELLVVPTLVEMLLFATTTDTRFEYKYFLEELSRNDYLASFQLQKLHQVRLLGGGRRP
jgi:hypothetical protein